MPYYSLAPVTAWRAIGRRLAPWDSRAHGHKRHPDGAGGSDGAVASRTLFGGVHSSLNHGYMLKGVR
jgi:hypothetical protein